MIATLQTIWFILIVVLLIGYTVLDGFDLGVGILSLFAREEAMRRTMREAIGPFWDGNEVWLLTAGGALFAAFPPVYATIFSAAYLALMLLLVALILRAVSLEWHGREKTAGRRRYWDWSFAFGSLLAALLLGVAFGNVLRGLPIDADGNFTGTFFTLLNPFALLVGVTNLIMIANHGALYLVTRTEGELAACAKKWAHYADGAMVPLIIVIILAATLTQRHLLSNYHIHPVLLAFPLLALLAYYFAGHWNNGNKPRHAFAASSAGIGLLLISAAAALFPSLLPALEQTAPNLTAFNSSSSELTLRVMLEITVAGMVLVSIYTLWVYRAFSGKVAEGGQY